MNPEEPLVENLDTPEELSFLGDEAPEEEPVAVLAQESPEEEPDEIGPIVPVTRPQLDGDDDSWLTEPVRRVVGGEIRAMLQEQRVIQRAEARVEAELVRRGVPASAARSAATSYVSQVDPSQLNDQSVMQIAKFAWGDYSFQSPQQTAAQAPNRQTPSVSLEPVTSPVPRRTSYDYAPGVTEQDVAFYARSKRVDMSDPKQKSALYKELASGGYLVVKK